MPPPLSPPPRKAHIAAGRSCGLGEEPIKRDRKAPYKALLDAARLQFEGEEMELVLVLFQPVHLKLETSLSIDERAGVIRFLGYRPWLDPAPYSALVKLGAEELGRLCQKFRALERSFPVHLRVNETS